jgi:dihydrofolate reductase
MNTSGKNTNQILSLVVAAGERNEIGKDGRMPWHLPADLKHFKEVTMGKPVIMGRRTHESIGKALPGRRNIVVTRNPDYAAEGCEVAHSLPEALRLAGEAAEVMVIGGAELYREALPLAGRIYLTRVAGRFDADTYFPDFVETQWREQQRVHRPADERNAHACDFLVLERKTG